MKALLVLTGAAAVLAAGAATASAGALPPLVGTVATTTSTTTSTVDLPSTKDVNDKIQSLFVQTPGPQGCCRPLPE